MNATVSPRKLTQSGTLDVATSIEGRASPRLGLDPDVIALAVRRAHALRAQAFRESIGALWRFGRRASLRADLGQPCPTA